MKDRFQTKISHSEYQWKGISPHFEVIKPGSFDFSWLSHVGTIKTGFHLQISFHNCRQKKKNKKTTKKSKSKYLWLYVLYNKLFYVLLRIHEKKIVSEFLYYLHLYFIHKNIRIIKLSFDIFIEKTFTVLHTQLLKPTIFTTFFNDLLEIFLNLWH